jgi:hypothetical protein
MLVRVSSAASCYLFPLFWNECQKKVCVCACERKSDREKRERDELFLFCLLPKCSIRLLFTSRHRVEVKKMERTRRVVFNDKSTTLLHCMCACVRLLHSQSFFSVCVRAFGVCKYIHTSESRQIEKKGEKRKKVGAENEWKTHELFYSFSMLDSREGRRGRERGRKGTELKEKSKTEKKASLPSEKIIPQKGKRNQIVCKCV